MKMCFTIILCLIGFRCTSGDIKGREIQVANDEAAVGDAISASIDSVRPPITPEHRWIQVRQYFRHGQTTGDRDAPVHSPAHSAFPKQLLALQLTDTGYVEYKPCNGINQSIEVKMDTLVLNWALESVGYPIRNIHVNGTDFGIQCSDGLSGELNFLLEPLESPPSSYRFSWQDAGITNQWLVIPVEHRYRFDFVTNPCYERMIPERIFKEIDFEALRHK